MLDERLASTIEVTGAGKPIPLLQPLGGSSSTASHLFTALLAPQPRLQNPQQSLIVVQHAITIRIQHDPYAGRVISAVVSTTDACAWRSEIVQYFFSSCAVSSGGTNVKPSRW